MFTNLLMTAAVVAVKSVPVARAQDMTNVRIQSVSQVDGSASPAADASDYGGTRVQSASGTMVEGPTTRQPACVGPASICDIFKSGQ